MKTKPDKKKNTKWLEELALGSGASVFGVGDIKPVRKYFHASIKDKTSELPFGISMGFKLSDDIIDDILDRPTLIYKHHYSTVNHFLDQLALKICSEIQKKNYKAIAIPASQMVDWEKQLGHLPHKAIAFQAGLGWIGRSNLLISPQFGARVRYVTILTDFPLVTGKPLENKCGACIACIKVCPAKAISKNAYDKNKCVEKLKEFSHIHGIGQSICGVCVKACTRK